MLGYGPMEKKKMLPLCNMTWSQSALESGENWPEPGSLNYSIILQLELFCKTEERRDEITKYSVYAFVPE